MRIETFVGRALSCHHLLSVLDGNALEIVADLLACKVVGNTTCRLQNKCCYTIKLSAVFGQVGVDGQGEELEAVASCEGNDTVGYNFQGHHVLFGVGSA